MRLTLLLLLVVQAGFLLAQPKWVFDGPVSESGKFYYFVGESESRDGAFLDALEALAFEVGAITAEFSTEQKRKIINETSSTDFERSGKITIEEEDLFVFPVRRWNDGDFYYILIGSPKKGRSTEGGVMPKGKFIVRSSFVPGWGQFLNKEPSKGLLFSVGTVGLIGGTIYSFNRSKQQGDQADLALLQGSLAQYNTYNQNQKTWKTTGTIMGIGAAALWIINIVDATASEKNLYVFNDQQIKLNLLASVNQVGLKLTF